MPLYDLNLILKCCLSENGNRGIKNGINTIQMQYKYYFYFRSCSGKDDFPWWY